MAIARSLSEVTEFKHEGTTFFIRQLPHRIMLRLEGMQSADMVELLLRAAISGWDNLEGAGEAKLEDATIAGTQVKQALTLECYDLLPFPLLAPLTTAVTAANRLQDDEAGN